MQASHPLHLDLRVGTKMEQGSGRWREQNERCLPVLPRRRAGRAPDPADESNSFSELHRPAQPLGRFRSAGSLRGMSLLEVLVAATLLGVGVVATFQCLGAISDSQRRAIESEEMQRLALRKFDDLLTQGTLTVGQADGDFSEISEPRFIWHAERESTGTGNLDLLKVEVGPIGDNYRHAQKIQGLICRPASSGGSS